MAETTTKPPPLAPLPLRAPLIDRATLLITSPWSQWLGISRQRQGGANAPSNSDLDGSLTQTQADIAALQAELDTTQADLAALQAELDQTQADLAATQAELDLTQTQLAATQAELDQTQAQLASDLPPGTALSVPRYQADGVGLETTPGLSTTAEGKLGIGVPVPIEPLAVAGGVTVGAASAAPPDGTLQWTGTDLQGRVNGSWVSLTTGTLPVGPPYSALRIVAGGTGQEAAPGVYTSSETGQLLLCQAAPPPSYPGANALVIERDGTTQMLMTAGGATAGISATLSMRSAPGTLSTPTATQPGMRLGIVGMGGHDGTTYKGFTGVIRADGTEAWSGTANGTTLRFQTVLTGSTTLAERLRIDGQGNLSTGGEVTSGLQAGVALKNGTAPASSVMDTVQLWSQDRGGAAGQSSLMVRSEDGSSHVLGNVLGVNTLCAASLGSGEVYRRLTVNGPHLFVGASSTQERPQALLLPAWVSSTDATRTARLTFSVHDSVAAREGLRLETSGTAPMVGFLGAAAVGRQTGGVATAAATYGANEQGMLQRVYDALRAYGLMT